MEGELYVTSKDAVLVAPCLPTPKTVLYLSNIDDHPLTRMTFNVMLVYNAHQKMPNDPAKIIREALSKVLVNYYPLAGRLRNSQIENGKLQMECTGEGALFVEATAHNTLSVLGDLEHLKPSFQQLLFQFPSNIDIEDLRPLVVQITGFRCGGLVMGVSFHHSVCDGRGAGKFLKHLAEIVKGDMTPPLQPIWHRELLKPRDPPHVEFQHLETIEENGCVLPPPKADELVQFSLVLNPETIKELKKYIMQECKELCSTFEVVAAIVWRARTKALQIPHNRNVKLLFVMDARKKFNPALPEGYYGNAVASACAIATAQELIEESLLHTVKIIQKTKLALNDDYLRSNIDFVQMNRHTLNGDIFMTQENMLLSDWRWLGFDEVDFGWGAPTNVSPVVLTITCNAHIFILLKPPNNMDGIKIVVFIPATILKPFELEMQEMIRKYATQASEEREGTIPFLKQVIE